MSDEHEYRRLSAEYNLGASGYSPTRDRLRELFDAAVAYGRRQLVTAGTPYWVAQDRIREALQGACDVGYINDFYISGSDAAYINSATPPPGREERGLRSQAITEARLRGDLVVQERDRQAYSHAVDRLADDEEVRTDNVAAFFFNRGSLHGRASNREERRTWKPMTEAPRDGSPLIVRVPNTLTSGSYSYVALQHAAGTGLHPHNEPALWLGESGVVVSSDDTRSMEALFFIRMPTTLPPPSISAAAPPVPPPEPQNFEPVAMQPRPNRRMRL